MLVNKKLLFSARFGKKVKVQTNAKITFLGLLFGSGGSSAVL